MIAQLNATRHPERVLSLTSIMSTVGGPNVVPADPSEDRRFVRSSAKCPGTRPPQHLNQTESAALEREKETEKCRCT
jgi:hypothetical protein